MTTDAATAGKTAAESFERKAHGEGGNIKGVMDEINASRSNPEFMQSFNAALSDKNNDVLPGFELYSVDKEGDAHFKDKNGARVEYDADGNRNEQWGKEENDREFTINEDGSATHVVKKHETVWGIAKDVLREKLGREPSNKEVADEVKKIHEANKPPKGTMEDPNKIYPDQKVIIPSEDVADVKQKRGEHHIGKDENGKVTDVVSQETGTQVKIERDKDGHATAVTVKDKEGKERRYEKDPEKGWVKVDPDTGEKTPINGSVEEKADGTIVVDDNDAQPHRIKVKPDGTLVEVNQDKETGKETKTITRPDGTVESKEAKQAESENVRDEARTNTVKVEAEDNGQPTKVTEHTADGDKTYVKQGDKWYVDNGNGQLEPAEGVSFEKGKNGEVIKRDEKKEQSTIYYPNGNVAIVTGPSPALVMTVYDKTTGKTYQQDVVNGEYTVYGKDGNKTEEKVANDKLQLQPDGSVKVGDGAAQTGKEYTAESGRSYSIDHTDESGTPDQFTVKEGDKVMHYRKNGSNWEQSSDGQNWGPATGQVSVSKAGETVQITIAKSNSSSRTTYVTVTLTPDGKAAEASRDMYEIKR